MNDRYDKLIEVTRPGDYSGEFEDAVESCECISNYSIRIVTIDADAVKSILDDLYDIVRNSVYTVSEFVSPKKDRISFVNGSYIDVEIQN